MVLASAMRTVSSSQMATKRARSGYRRTPGISESRAWRPQPICATWIKLLGAVWPKTVDGTIVGKPTPAARAPFKNCRREESGCLLSEFVIVPPANSVLAHGPKDSAQDLLVEQRIGVVLFLMAESRVKFAAAVELLIPGEG